MPSVVQQGGTRVEVVADDIDTHLRQQIGPITRAGKGIDQAAVGVARPERHGIGVGDGPAVFPDQSLPVRYPGHALCHGLVETEFADHRCGPEAVRFDVILDGVPERIADGHSLRLGARGVRLRRISTSPSRKTASDTTTAAMICG